MKINVVFMRYYLQRKIYYFVFLYVRVSSISLVSVTNCFLNYTIPTVCTVLQIHNYIDTISRFTLQTMFYSPDNPTLREVLFSPSLVPS